MRTVGQIRATAAALNKLGARDISRGEAEQILNNAYVIVRNLRGRQKRRQLDIRRIMIGRTNGGRMLTLVIEETPEPTTWLIITGWDSSAQERTIPRRGESMSNSRNQIPDPEPGDFDAELATVSNADLEFVEAGSGAEFAIEILIAGEDALRLGQIATERDQSPSEVIAELIRSA